VGLHSGDHTTVTLRPAAPGSGRYFVRCDHDDLPIIPATIAAVCQTQLSTELAAHSAEADSARVRTVEHLLAALAAAGVQDVAIEIDGPEVPLLDGSAQDWCRALHEAGLAPLEEGAAKGETRLIDTPLSIQQGDASVTALPSTELRFSYGIALDDAAIGEQWHSWTPTGTLENFAAEIGQARTFGLAHQVEQLQAAGLIRGGSLENALVCDGDRWLNPPLRFANEPVRHKILDLVGDLSLLGTIPTAHYIAYKASHALHVALARMICQRPS